MPQITVLGMYNKVPTSAVAVDTTSRGGRWSGLSPFNLGPIPLYTDPTYGPLNAQNFENAWQYAKVYEQHADGQGNPTQTYWNWACAGWLNHTPQRYPMGKGARPLYSLWNGMRLGYIDARKWIYGPLYRQLVTQTRSFQELQTLMQGTDPIVLRDYDGYDHDKLGMSLTDVLNNPRKKMGHAFVLKAILTNDPMLQEFKP
jgi:hypothetical protein